MRAPHMLRPSPDCQRHVCCLQPPTPPPPPPQVPQHLVTVAAPPPYRTQPLPPGRRAFHTSSMLTHLAFPAWTCKQLLMPGSYPSP
eukprot:190468-Chlamydomonas_euryale.AAC.1